MSERNQVPERVLRTEAEMLEFGAALGRALPSLAAPLVLFLTGELGAGKTTLTRGMLAALGVTRPVRSPSYTLVESYALGAATVLHVDLYRLVDPDELEPLGLRELHRPGHLWVVEWPDRGGDLLPAPDLVLALAVAEAGHTLRVVEGTDRGLDWLQRSNPPGN